MHGGALWICHNVPERDQNRLATRNHKFLSGYGMYREVGWWWWWITMAVWVVVVAWVMMWVWIDMVTSSNGNIFRVTGPLWRKPLVIGGFTKASDAELWCFFDLRLNNRKNNRDAVDLRRQCAHCDVTVMVAWGSWVVDGGEWMGV